MAKIFLVVPFKLFGLKMSVGLGSWGVTEFLKLSLFSLIKVCPKMIRISKGLNARLFRQLAKYHLN
jgi:hypothetical protein